MVILLVGGLSVNPERFLPLINNHTVYIISSSTPNWRASLYAGGPYCEIKEITIDDIPRVKPDIIWNLISPWDGAQVVLDIKLRYPDIPVIRQSQGGITPFWHSNPNRSPNYSFDKYKESIEISDAIMINCELYRDCLIDQGCDIKDKPYLITNGMAANLDILPELPPIEVDKQPSCVVIGRRVFPEHLLMERGILFYDHSLSGGGTRHKALSSKYVRVPYRGDVHILGKRPISLFKTLAFKQAHWTNFSKYNAGLMHNSNEYRHDYYKGYDVNVPGRVNTYILSGIPPIINDLHSGIHQLLKEHGCAITYKNIGELVDKLNDLDYIMYKKNIVREVRYKFTAQYELPRLEKFFNTLRK